MFPLPGDLPIFLQRNYRRMKGVRKMEELSLTKNYGLQAHIIPQINSLRFQQHTEDHHIVNRRQHSLLGKRDNPEETSTQSLLK